MADPRPMGDLIDLDSRRRRRGTRRWTRAEDYGARKPARPTRLTRERWIALGWAALVLAVAGWVLWPQLAAG